MYDIAGEIVTEIALASEAKRAINIELLIRNSGILLDRKADLDSEIAGQIEFLPDEKMHKISVNKNDHYYRQRFTMAHELGHYFFHRDLIGSGIDDTKAYRSSQDSKFKNVKIQAQQETEANRFAAKILMPEELIKSIAKDIVGDNLSDLTENQIIELAKKLQVSKQALTYRLSSL